MNRELSVFLDFLRFFAALLVFFGHFSHPRFTGELLSSYRGIEHDAVIVFFVLSGYVISFVSKNKDNSLSDYLVSRLSRLYSVVIPAILVTVIADSIGRANDSGFYNGVFSDSYPVIRVLANLLFAQEFWGAGIRLFSNGPFWSLSYEFSYYILFAAWVYLSGWKRYFICVIGAIVVGPNILLLAPIWLLGVFLENMDCSKFNTRTLLVWMFVSLFLFVFYKMNIQEILPIFTSLSWSHQFIHDYVVGIFVATQIFVVKGLIINGVIKFRKNKSIIEKAIKISSSYTFSLYLYHFPLLMMIYSVFSPNINDWLNLLLVVCVVLLLVFWLGSFTEKKKHFYTVFFRRLLTNE